MPTTTPIAGINGHTAGPVAWVGTRSQPGARVYLQATKDAPEPFAQVVVIFGGKEPEEADARLLAASFNAFDKAGREMQIDPGTLAESVDVAELIRALSSAASLCAVLAPELANAEFPHMADLLRKEEAAIRAALQPVQTAAGRD